MGCVLRFWYVVLFTIKRLFAQFGLALISLLGLVASLTLVISIPLYADAVNHSILSSKVLRNEVAEGDLPFSFRFEFYGLWSGSNQWEDVKPLDDYLQNSTQSVLEMPLERVVRYFVTDYFEIYPENTQVSEVKIGDAESGLVSLGMMSGIENHIRLLEGEFSRVYDQTEMGQSEGYKPVDVLVSLRLANRMGLQVGDTYTVIATPRPGDDVNSNLKLPIRISGIWQPENAQDSYWMFEPSRLDTVLIVPEETFTNFISPINQRDVSLGVWQLLLDGSVISADEVDDLLNRINTYEKRASGFLPNFRLVRSPVKDLLEFQKASEGLMVLLFAFAIPILGLILLFIMLVANLSIERRRNEIAVLRSRGASAWQVLGSITLEIFILGVVSLVISFLLAGLVTRGIGLTRSFMDFSARTNLQVNLSRSALIAGFITLLIISIVTLIPAFNAVRHTIISYKQERARRIRPPFWQRIWLDMLLLIPVVYGTYLLSRQGSILIVGSNDPLANPLLYLVPSLGVFVLSLFFLRLLPHLTRGLSWLLERTNSVGVLLATRQLSRSRDYEIPVLILILTFSLSIFTASLARTLDLHLVSRTSYQVGADIRFLRVGTGDYGGPSMPGEANVGTSESLSFPVSEYLKIRGIEDVTRVGQFPAEIRLLLGQKISGTYYGVERLDFPRLANWRDDYAYAPLLNLMNALGAVPEGVLAPVSFLEQNGLKEGDTVEIAVATDLGRVVINSRIVGSFNLFPTWYEQEAGPLFVGNLDYLFDRVGGYATYQVWAKTNPDFNYEKVRDITVSDLNVHVLSWLSTLPKILSVQERPEQQGIFGFLFIGFSSAALMTVVGFLLYALFSYQRRFVELGVLRAGGLSRRQLTAYLAFELLFLIVTGAGLGTALGSLISRLYIPYLQVGDAPYEKIPPFQVIIAWDSVIQIYFLFGILFIVTLVILLVMLQRKNIFQAIKLGETL